MTKRGHIVIVAIKIMYRLVTFCHSQGWFSGTLEVCSKILYSLVVKSLTPFSLHSFGGVGGWGCVVQNKQKNQNKPKIWVSSCCSGLCTEQSITYIQIHSEFILWCFRSLTNFQITDHLGNWSSPSWPLGLLYLTVLETYWEHKNLCLQKGSVCAVCDKLSWRYSVKLWWVKGRPQLLTLYAV